MTPIELRIKFKSETGYPPTYGRTQLEQSRSCNYQGGLTHEYAEWLENDDRFLRDEFHKHYGSIAFIKDNKRNVRYSKAYKEWLEEKRCKEL
jgi:hypothetical protein